jgi:hypothetical protein
LVPLYAFSIVSLLIQVGLIVHVVKTGRSWLWVAAIGFLPGAGTLAYVSWSCCRNCSAAAVRGARNPASSASSIRIAACARPTPKSRFPATSMRAAGSPTSSSRAANTIGRSRSTAAASTGIFEHDPALLLGLARAQFAKQDYAAARITLQRLADHNADFKSADARLLYARTLEAVGALEESEREYAAIAPAFPGAEARLRYGLLLKRRGKIEESRRVLKDLFDSAEIGPRHYRKAQAEWLQLARSELPAPRDPRRRHRGDCRGAGDLPRWPALARARKSRRKR